MATQTNSQQVMRFLIQLGFTPVQAAGITGNLVQETGNFNPDVISGKRRGDNGTAFGMMQWRHDRQRNFFNFAREINRDPYDWRTQLMFIKAEMTPGKYADQGAMTAYRQLQTARNPVEAAAAFVHAERPQGYSLRNPRAAHGFANRARAAQQAFGGSGADTQERPVFDTTGAIQRNNFDSGIGKYSGTRNFTDDYNDYGSFTDNMGYNSPYSSERKSTYNPLSYSDFDAGSPFNLSLGNNNLNYWGNSGIYGNYDAFADLGARGRSYG